MHYRIPYRNIIIIALITVPLFAVFGAVPMPALLSGRFTWPEVFYSLSAIAVTTLLFWVVNTLLLNFFTARMKHGWLRYITSIILCGVLGLFIMQRMHPMREGRLRARAMANLNQPPFHVPGRPIPPPQNSMTGKERFLFFPLLQIQSMNIMILILLEVIVLRSKKERIEKENDQLRMANLEARHNLLKQQLQPHFLFNSLMTVKALMRKEPDKAAAYVDRLSGLLRYAVYSNTRFSVTVQEELNYVKGYLEMQQIRFGEALVFLVDIPDEFLKGTLPVYSLQLLVENALKHNQFTEAQPLTIRVTADAGQRRITVENNRQPKIQAEANTGLGLKNLSERYMLFADTTVDVKETPDFFSVSVKILGNEDSDY